MAVKCFEELVAWQKAQDLAVTVYETFSSCKDFGFRDQICEAAVSISNNIAEGFDRSSNAEFTRFLWYALGSCSEVKSMVYLGARIKVIQAIQKDSLLAECVEVSKVITGLRKAVQ